MNESKARVSILEPHEPKEHRKKPSRRAKWMVVSTVLILTVAGVITGIEVQRHRHKPVTSNHYSAQDVTAAVNSVNSGAAVPKFTSYSQAYVAGSVYAANGQNEKAYDAYQQAVQLANRPSAQLYVTLAQLAQQLHKSSDAKAYYQKAVKAPDFTTSFPPVIQTQYKKDAQ